MKRSRRQNTEFRRQEKCFYSDFWLLTSDFSKEKEVMLFQKN